MKTKDEILIKNYIDPVYLSATGIKENTYKAMDEYAKQVAVDFHEYCMRQELDMSKPMTISEAFDQFRKVNGL